MREFLLEQYEHFYGGSLPGGFVFDLQRFAAADEGRTEDPTEKRLREAREKGQVARTQELPQAVVVIAGVVVIAVLGSWMADSLARIMKYYLTTFSRFSMTEVSMRLHLITVLIEIGRILMPMFMIVVIAALLSNLVQVGFQFSLHPLQFDLSKIKIDPATIMKKIFFSKQIAMNLFKSLFKVIAIGLIAYLIIMDDFNEILSTPDLSLKLSVHIVLVASLKIIIWSSVFILALAIPDYFFQKAEFIESLKMTKQEIKEEMKETVGDPHIRARLREMQRDIVLKNMIKDVPKADVIVTNPTHFSVALKYDRLSMVAPQVVAKGVDSMALKIRQIARENKIPLIENRPLAQEMYKRLNVGDEVPAELFYAVSLVYAELYRRKNVRQAI